MESFNTQQENQEEDLVIDPTIENGHPLIAKSLRRLQEEISHASELYVTLTEDLKPGELIKLDGVLNSIGATIYSLKSLEDAKAQDVIARIIYRKEDPKTVISDLEKWL